MRLLRRPTKAGSVVLSLLLPVTALAAVALVPAAGQDVADPGPSPDALDLVASIEPQPGTTGTAVRVFGFNDFHGQLNSPGSFAGGPAGGSPQFYDLLRTLRSQHPRSATVAAGDLIGASQLQSALFDDEPTLLTYSAFGVDFAAVGNHEFDEGRADLERKQDGGCTDTPVEDPPQACVFADPDRPAAEATAYPGTSMQYLAANVRDRSTGEALFGRPSGIKTFPAAAGAPEVKLGFIGATLEATPTIVSASGISTLRFIDEAEAANAEVEGLKAAGAKTITMLIHQGGQQTGSGSGIDTCASFMGPDLVDVVNRLDDDIKVVISGHSHQAYNCTLDTPTGPKLVTSANFGGRVLTDIDMTIAADGTLARAAATNRLVSTTAQTPAAGSEGANDPAYQRITRLRQAANDQAAPRANRVIGTITADITRSATDAGESALGDVIADAQLRASDATRDPNASAVIAFMNPGGIRTDLLRDQVSGGEQPGEVTFGESFNVQPFGNNLTTKTFTGAQIERLLEQQFPGCFGQGASARVLQVSQGFGYTRDDDRPRLTGDPCDRIDPATIRLNGTPLVPTQSYRVTMNSFLADGGDAFSTFREGTDVVGGVVDTVALENFFQADPDGVAPGPRNRIAFVPAQSGPAPVIPEAPYAVLLPLAAGTAAGTALLVAVRRRSERAS